MKDQLIKDLKKYGFVIIGIALYLVLFQLLFHEVCPFKIFLGIECPCCGYTHATIYMFTGEFKEALSTNWTVILWWVFFVVFLFDRYVKKIKIKPIPYLLIFVGTVTMIKYLFYIFSLFK